MGRVFLVRAPPVFHDARLTELRSAQDYLPPPTKRVYVCAVCSASGTECQLTSCHEIISKSFQGRNGQAYAPSQPTTSSAPVLLFSLTRSLENAQLSLQLRHQRLDGSGRGARDADGRARRPRHLLHLLPEQRRLEIRAPPHTPAPASFASAHRSANVRESFLCSPRR